MHPVKNQILFLAIWKIIRQALCSIQHLYTLNIIVLQNSMCWKGFRFMLVVA